MIYSFTMFDRIKIEFRLTNHRSQYFITLLSVRYLMWFYSKCVFIFGFQWKYFIKKKVYIIRFGYCVLKYTKLIYILINNSTIKKVINIFLNAQKLINWMKGSLRDKRTLFQHRYFSQFYK